MLHNTFAYITFNLIIRKAALFTFHESFILVFVHEKCKNYSRLIHDNTNITRLNVDIPLTQVLEQPFKTVRLLINFFYK